MNVFYEHRGDKLIVWREDAPTVYIKQRFVLPLLTRLKNAIDSGWFTLPNAIETPGYQTHSDIALAERMITRSEHESNSDPSDVDPDDGLSAMGDSDAMPDVCAGDGCCADCYGDAGCDA